MWRSGNAPALGAGDHGFDPRPSDIFGMWDFILTWILLLSSRAIGVVSSPVHSVLFLVLTFFVASVALLSMGREFLSLRFMVVYMGAIAVLFLFVVMMLDLKEKESDDPLTGSVGFLSVLFFIPSLVFSLQHLSSKPFQTLLPMSTHGVSSIESMGQVLYTELWIMYLIAGFVLLVALIGAVVLAVPRPYSRILRKEDLSAQLSRDASDSIFTVVK